MNTVRRFNCGRDLLAFIESRTPRVWHITVLHDDDAGCTPSSCRCSPEYELREGTAESFIEGARRTREWIRKVAS